MKKLFILLILLVFPFIQSYSQDDNTKISVGVTMTPIYKMDITGSDGIIDFSFKGEDVYYNKQEFIITIGASHHYILDILVQDCYLIDEKGNWYNLLNHLYYFFYRVENTSNDEYNIDWTGDNEYTYFKQENNNVIKSLSTDALGEGNVYEMGIFIDQKFKEYLISNNINSGKIYFNLTFSKRFQNL